MVLPDEDKYSQTRSEMLDKLAYMLGGRAAEEMVFHDPTTGAGNDIEKATSLARAMVTQYGMTERLGAIKLGDGNSEPFLGRDMGHQRNYSEDVAAMIDEEVKKLLATAHQEAFDILEENRDVLDALVLELLDKETLDKEQVAGSSSRCGRRARARPGPARPTATRRRSRRSRSRRRSATGSPPTAHGARRGARAASSSRRPAPAATSTATPADGGAAPRRRPADGRHDRPDQPRAAPRGRARRSTTPGPRRPSASCCSRSARTPTARACATPRPGWPGRTPS